MTNYERVTPTELLQFLSAHANNPPYIPERDDEPEAPAPLSPEREAEIRGWLAELKSTPTVGMKFDERSILADVLAELDRVRAERDELKKRVAELERPAIEARRNAIRDSYQELAVQAREERDYEGEARALHALEAREAQWAAEDAKAGDR